MHNDSFRHMLFVAAIPLLAASVVADESGFLAPPHYIGTPKPLHAATNRAFQGIPSMAVTPGGRLWATWYASKTPGEDHNNYVVLTTSGDNGATWQEVLVVDPDEDGPVRAFDPELWMAPDGQLRLANSPGGYAGRSVRTADPLSREITLEATVTVDECTGSGTNIALWLHETERGSYFLSLSEVGGENVLTLWKAGPGAWTFEKWITHPLKWAEGTPVRIKLQVSGAELKPKE